MSYSKRLVILAKSIKFGNFCIAGKDIKTNNWVRPVKKNAFNGKELSNFSNHDDPIKIFEVVEMTFINKTPEIYQPENEKVDMKVKWNYLGELEIGNLDPLIDRDKNDFLDKIKANSINKSRIQSLNLKNSLQLIKISKTNDAKIIYQLDYSQKYYKPRLLFNYKGIAYNLPITASNIPILKQKRTLKTIKEGYITIGIGGEFKKSYYIFVVMLEEI